MRKIYNVRLLLLSCTLLNVIKNYAGFVFLLFIYFWHFDVSETIEDFILKEGVLKRFHEFKKIISYFDFSLRRWLTVVVWITGSVRRSVDDNCISFLTILEHPLSLTNIQKMIFLKAIIILITSSYDILLNISKVSISTCLFFVLRVRCILDRNITQSRIIQYTLKKSILLIKEFLTC